MMNVPAIILQVMTFLITGVIAFTRIMRKLQENDVHVKMEIEYMKKDIDSLKLDLKETKISGEQKHDKIMEKLEILNVNIAKITPK